MLKKRNKKGFTLIEIILVLIILGILASFAVPKYFDLQSAARSKAVEAAIGALQSTACMYYVKGVLNGTFDENSWTPPSGTINVGDYYGTITGSGPVTVTVTGGPYAWNSGVTNVSKDFNLW